MNKPKKYSPEVRERAVWMVVAGRFQWVGNCPRTVSSVMCCTIRSTRVPMCTAAVRGRWWSKKAGRRSAKVHLGHLKPPRSLFKAITLAFSWTEYERNQQRMRRNRGNFGRDESVLTVRAGHGLLTGLLRCARCGRKLSIGVNRVRRPAIYAKVIFPPAGTIVWASAGPPSISASVTKS